MRVYYLPIKTLKSDCNLQCGLADVRRIVRSGSVSPYQIHQSGMLLKMIRPFNTESASTKEIRAA